MTTVAQELAAFLTPLTVADLPDRTLDYAAMIVASTLSSAACGTAIQSARIIQDLAHDQGGRPEASIWFDGGPRLPVALAAQANAVLSDAAASDDSDLRAIVHAGTPLTATALAIAERDGLSGAEVLAAIVTGYEAAGRITGPISPDFRDRGFHGCLGAAFAATAAAARLFRLTVDQTAHAIALIATSVGGLVVAADTSVSREYHAGAAVHQGITAARAAQRGYTGELSVLEARRGFFEAFGGKDGTSTAKAALAELGCGWDIIEHMAIKLVPGGHPYHALAEAGAKAARAGNVTPEQVRAIVVSRPGTTALHGPRHPRDLIDMAHSPAYFTAAGVADRRFGWDHAGPVKIADPVIHRLIDLVRVGPPPADPAPYRQGATVSIETTDGRTWTETVHLPHGSGALGIDWADIEAKFRALMPASGLSDGAIEAAWLAARDLRGAAGVADLMAALRR
ncbi:MAG: MmgE/PrpD family protein [Acetobacteraceae bacterium]